MCLNRAHLRIHIYERERYFEQNKTRLDDVMALYQMRRRTSGLRNPATAHFVFEQQKNYPESFSAGKFLFTSAILNFLLFLTENNYCSRIQFKELKKPLKTGKHSLTVHD